MKSGYGRSAKEIQQHEQGCGKLSDFAYVVESAPPELGQRRGKTCGKHNQPVDIFL